MSRSVILATVGALALGLAVLLIARKDTRRRSLRTQSWCLLLFGLCGSGALGAWRDHVAHSMASASADQTSVWVGVAVPYLVAMWVVIWWVLDMDFDGLWHQVRAKLGGGGQQAGGRSVALATAGGTGATRTLPKVNRHKCRWYTPLLGLLVMPCLAICPVVGQVPDGLRNGLVRLLFDLGAHVSGS